MDRIGYIMMLLLGKVVRFIPFQFLPRISVVLGNLLYCVDFKHRKISLMNLDMAFPTMPKEEKKKIARDHFRNLARTTLEFLSLPKINRDNYKEFVSHEGENNYAEAEKKGKGVLFLAAHFGNWELMAYVHPFLFGPTFSLARRFKNRRIDQFINRIRGLSGNKVIDKKNAYYKVMKELKGGNAVGVLMDQSVHPNEAVYVDFFGKFVSTTPFIAQMALRRGCSVIPVFDYPQDDGRHLVRYFPEIEMIESEDEDDPVVFNTERLNRFIEERITERPELWLWSHKRWKNISDERCWGRVKKREGLEDELPLDLNE